MPGVVGSLEITNNNTSWKLHNNNVNLNYKSTQLAVCKITKICGWTLFTEFMSTRRNFVMLRSGLLVNYRTPRLVRRGVL